MTQNFNETLRKLREKAKIDSDFAAKIFGMTIPEYRDLEGYPDEWLTAPSALTIKNILLCFDMHIGEYVELPIGRKIEEKTPLNEFIKSMRESLGATQTNFSDKVGFVEQFAEVIEGHPLGLFLWPCEVTILLCRTYELDANSIFGKLVRKQ